MCPFKKRPITSTWGPGGAHAPGGDQSRSRTREFGFRDFSLGIQSFQHSCDVGSSFSPRRTTCSIPSVPNLLPDFARPVFLSFLFLLFRQLLLRQLLLLLTSLLLRLLFQLSLLLILLPLLVAGNDVVVRAHRVAPLTHCAPRVERPTRRFGAADLE